MVPVAGFRSAREHRPAENHAGDHHGHQRSHVPPPCRRHPWGSPHRQRRQACCQRAGPVQFVKDQRVCACFFADRRGPGALGRGRPGRRERSGDGVFSPTSEGVMRRSTIAFAAACVGALLVVEGGAQTSTVTRLAWGDPDLEGTWTNATLTTLQRAPELGTKAYFTREEAAAFDRQRAQATNADRPLRPGEVGAYNDAFFERGRGVKTGRTSLVVDPPDGRIPPFTPDAQKRFDARQRDEELHPADRPSDRWLTERCILFGATVPMLPEPYNNNYRIVQSPGVVTIAVEMNHDTRVIPIDGRPPIGSQIAQWTGSSRGHWEGDPLVVETENFKFNEKSRFGVE